MALSYYEKYRKPMELPEGKTCKDCIHWKPTCEWLLSNRKGNEVSCDWLPSRFVEIQCP